MDVNMDTGRNMQGWRNMPTMPNMPNMPTMPTGADVSRYVDELSQLARNLDFVSDKETYWPQVWQKYLERHPLDPQTRDKIIGMYNSATSGLKINVSRLQDEARKYGDEARKYGDEILQQSRTFSDYGLGNEAFWEQLFGRLQELPPTVQQNLSSILQQLRGSLKNVPENFSDQVTDAVRALRSNLPPREKLEQLSRSVRDPEIWRGAAKDLVKRLDSVQAQSLVENWNSAHPEMRITLRMPTLPTLPTLPTPTAPSGQMEQIMQALEAIQTDQTGGGNFYKKYMKYKAKYVNRKRELGLI